jgi:hypothetical protein
MRAPLLIFVLIMALLPAFAGKDESVDELKKRAEAAKIEDQPPLCSQIAQRQLGVADKLYTEGKVEEARAAIDDVVKYSGQASTAAVKTGKHLKHTEITIRKMAERLRTIRHSLAFDDQPPVQDAADRLESMRNDLLSRMFSKGSK